MSQVPQQRAGNHLVINYIDVQSTVSGIIDNVRELDIHIFYTPETSAEVCKTHFISFTPIII